MNWKTGAALFLFWVGQIVFLIYLPVQHAEGIKVEHYERSLLEYKQVRSTYYVDLQDPDFRNLLAEASKVFQDEFVRQILTSIIGFSILAVFAPLFLKWKPWLIFWGWFPTLIIYLMFNKIFYLLIPPLISILCVVFRKRLKS